MRTGTAWAVSVLPVLVADALVAGWPAVVDAAFLSWATPVSQTDWHGLLAFWFLAHVATTVFVPRIAGPWIGTAVGHAGGGLAYVLLALPGEHPIAGLFLMAALYGGAVGLLGCAAGSLVRGYLPRKERVPAP